MKRYQAFIRMIAVLTLTRLVINMTRRFAYPFLPEIARQYNVGLPAVQSVMSFQAGIGVTSPLFGPLGERFGRKRVMQATLILMALISVLGAIVPGFPIFAIVMLVYGFGKMIFDPAMLAYLGDRVAYERRGLAIGITELSWAGSLIIAGPVTGILLELSGIQLILMILGFLLLGFTLAIERFLVQDEPTHINRRFNLSQAWQTIRANPAAQGALLFSFLHVCANEIFFINYGVWMEESFGLVLAALGAVTTVIAIAEISGEFVVIGIADRVGKRPLTILTTGVAAACYVVLPSLSESLPLTLVGLFVLFLCVETSIVASIALFTEVLPDARAVMMSANVGAHSLGRLTGGTLGGLLYASDVNFVTMGLLAAGIGAAATVCLWIMVPEARPQFMQ